MPKNTEKKPVQWHLLIFGFVILIASLSFDYLRKQNKQKEVQTIQKTLRFLIREDFDPNEISPSFNISLFLIETNGKLMFQKGEIPFTAISNQVLQAIPSQKEGFFFIRDRNQRIQTLQFLRGKQSKIALILKQPAENAKKKTRILLILLVFSVLLAFFILRKILRH